MALMQTLRTKTHFVMIIIIFSFIGLIGLEWGADVAGRGPANQNTVGVINGEKIPYEEIRFEYEQLRELERQQSGGDIDQFRNRQIINEIWNRRVEFTLLQQEIGKYDIVISDAELFEAIKENPPEFIKQQAIFQTDGQFDQTKYLQSLNNPNVSGWEYLEVQYRMLLPRQKVINRITSLAHVTDLEVKTAYIAQNEKVEIKYYFFDPNQNAADPTTVTDEAMKSYFDTHQDEFKQDSRMELSYVIISKQPSVLDSQRVERQINDLYDQIIGGADFEILAKDFSEDPSNASQGGDLGFFGHGDMVDAFETVAYQTPVGEVASPVRTQFGWHIIKVEEKRKENGEDQVRARHILLKTVIGQQTLKDLQSSMDRILTQSRENGFQQAIQSAPESLTVQSTGLFTERPDGFIPRIGYLIGAAAFSSDGDPGDFSEILENDTGFYIIQLTDRKPEGVQTLEEVENRIRAVLNRDQKMDLAKEAGEQFKTKLTGKNLDSLSGDEADEVKTPEAFAHQAFIPGVGQDLSLIGAAFQLKTPGEMSDLVKGDRGYYLVQLVEHQPIDNEAFNSSKDNLQKELLIQKQNQLYSEWLADLEENAEIENNLSRFFSF